MRIWRWTPLAALALGAGAALARAPEEEISALIARLRSARLSLEERDRIERELLGRGEIGARELARFVEGEIDRLGKRARASEKGYLASFAAAAAKSVDSRLDRAARREINELRAAILALRRDERLTKERIVETGDPARARLEELLAVAPEQVLAADGELAAQRAELGDLTARLEEAFALWTECNARLPERKRSHAIADPGPMWAELPEAEAWRCALATPMDERDRETLLANRALERELGEEEARGLLDLNLLRIRLGLHALEIDLKLCSAARGHSKDMRELGFFDHTSPVEGKRTPGDRAARAGTSASSENIAAGQTTGAGANRGWWHSPGHHKNMLGDWSRVGLGQFETLWTQMFG
jgi:hypothetical protein